MAPRALTAASEIRPGLEVIADDTDIGASRYRLLQSRLSIVQPSWRRADQGPPEDPDTAMLLATIAGEMPQHLSLLVSWEHVELEPRSEEYLQNRSRTLTPVSTQPGHYHPAQIHMSWYHILLMIMTSQVEDSLKHNGLSLPKSDFAHRLNCCFACILTNSNDWELFRIVFSHLSQMLYLESVMIKQIINIKFQVYLILCHINHAI